MSVRTPSFSRGPSIASFSKFMNEVRNAQCNTNFDEAREIRSERASVYATDHDTRRRRGGVSRIRRSGHQSSASSDGKTTTLHVSRTNHTSQTCFMVAIKG